jgi:hypothetical protein
MAIQLRTTERNTLLDAITSGISTSGLLRIYDGTPPANVAASLGANVLLAECACSATFAPAASSGVLTANAITSDSSANATGTASFFRLVTSGGTAILQGTVTATGGGGDLTFTSVAFVAGYTINITAFVLTAPGA